MIGVRVRGKLKRIYDVGGKVDRYNNYAAASGIAGGLLDQATPIDNYGVKNDTLAIGSGALKGAGTGAALGTSIMPGIGTAIGAGVGAIAGGINSVIGNDRAKTLRNQAIRQQNLSEVNRSNNIIRNYDTLGSNNNQVYAKFGGAIPVTKYVQGGNLKELSEENEEINGNSHEQGGVKLSDNVEVEGGETLNTEGKEPFVFSEKLGFAKLHKPIARAIGKLEKKVPNNITNNTIKLLKEKEQNLKVAQEEFKKQLGIRGVSEYALGGKVKGVTVGSPFNDNFINIDNYLYKKVR